MPEISIRLSKEALDALCELVRILAVPATHVAVNKANIPSEDIEIMRFWSYTLITKSLEDTKFLTAALDAAQGNPPLLVIENEALGLICIRAISSVRISTRELLLVNFTDEQLSNLEALDEVSMPETSRHSLACFACLGIIQQSIIAELHVDSLS